MMLTHVMQPLMQLLRYRQVHDAGADAQTSNAAARAQTSD